MEWGIVMSPDQERPFCVTLYLLGKQVHVATLKGTEHEVRKLVAIFNEFGMPKCFRVTVADVTEPAQVDPRCFTYR
jgi:hypothetical protein